MLMRHGLADWKLDDKDDWHGVSRAGRDFIENLLVENPVGKVPRARLSPEEALDHQFITGKKSLQLWYKQPLTGIWRYVTTG